MVSLGDIATYSINRISADELDASNYVGVDNLLPNRVGKKESSYVPNKGNLNKFFSGDVLIGNIRPYLKKIWFADRNGGANGDVLVIHRISSCVIPRFLYHVLSSDNFFDYDMKNARGAKMPRGSKEAIMQYSVILPSLLEQQRIVSILDRFDKLCCDINVGLPAEIDKRQKQYEFYRDKLLNFKEL